jgi:hypothetical protein
VSGNSLQVAMDINRMLGNIDLRGLATFIDEKVIEVKSRTLGIVFPVYYACLPLIIEKIVRKLEINCNSWFSNTNAKNNIVSYTLELRMI